MEMTEDAEPTITSPITLSSTTWTSSSVETDTRRLPMRMPRPRPSARAAAPRCAAERAVEAGVLAEVVRRGRGAVCRCVGAMLRVDVMAPTPSGRGRAAQPGPTPDACVQSPPRRGPSGGPRIGPPPGVRRRGARRSRELRHGEVVPVEDAEAQGAEEPAEYPEADDDRRLGPAAELEVMVDGGHPEDAPVESAEADDLQYDRDRLHHEEPADDEQQQIEVEQQAQRGQAGADGQ